MTEELCQLTQKKKKKVNYVSGALIKTLKNCAS